MHAQQCNELKTVDLEYLTYFSTTFFVNYAFYLGQVIVSADMVHVQRHFT